MKTLTLLIAAAFALSACGDQPEVTAEQATTQASVAQAAEPVATLNLDWDTFRQRVDEDFQSAGFGFAKIPASMKPEGDANAARLTVMLPINDNLVGNIASDPATGKLTSITATVGATEDAAENLKNFSSAALMLSSADGDDGNKTVGGKIIKMAGDAVNEFAKQALSDDEKLDTHEALRVTLKSAAATISVNDFAQNYLPEDKQKAYTEFMIAKDFPQNAVSKDIEYIKTRLRKRRSYGFSNGVVILTPPEHTQDYMEIAPTEDGEYTVVTIKGQLQQQK